MWVILRFTLKNIKEKKFRTFLIIFSILISTALFFASIAVSGTIEKMVTERIRKYFGTAEIMIFPGEKSPGDSISLRAAKSFSDDMEYIVGVVRGSGVFRYRSPEDLGHSEPVRLELHGYELDELAKMNPIIALKDYRLNPFKGKKLVISEKTAEKYQLSLGTQLDLEIGGYQHRFTIAGIAAPSGMFTETGYSITAVVPKDTLSSLLHMEKQVSTIYLRPKNPGQKTGLITALSKAYNRYVVRETISSKDIERSLESFSVPFLMMTVLVSCVSVFIIYTSFLVIIAERLPVIGTFRSIGATKKITDLVLLVESLGYGVIGGVLGCLAGVGALYVIVNSLLTPYDRAAGLSIEIGFSPLDVGIAFFAAVALALLSSLIPILKVARIPVKEIVLNQIQRTAGNKKWKGYAGVAALAASLILPPRIPVELAVGVNTGCMVTSVLGVVLCIPWITELFVHFFEWLYISLFGNEGVLAAKNLRGNKSMQNNIALLAIGISSLLFIFTVSHNVVRESTNVYRDLLYDIRIPYLEKADREKVGIIAAMEGVKDVYGSYGAEGIEVVKINGRSPSKREFITEIMSVDPNKYSQFLDFHIEGDEKQLFNALEAERSILLTYTLKNKYLVNTGDSIVLNTPNGKRDYKVVGFFRTVWENGQLALAAERYLRLDMKARYYNDIYVKTSKDPEIVVTAIKNRFKDKGSFMMTKRGFEKLDEDENAATLGILKGFSLMAMIIGIFGIMNNFAISFIERKRILAVMRSNGMSKGQIIKMIVVEALSGGIIGGAAGVLAGLPLIYILPYVLRAIDLPEIKTQLAPSLMAGAFTSGIIVTLIASLSPSMKSSKLNIIEAIKYE